EEIWKQVVNEMFLAASGQATGATATPTAESLYGQAFLKNKLDSPQETRKLYEQCIEKYPEDPVAYNDLAWLDLTDPSPNRSALIRAQKYASTAVKLATKGNLTELAPYLDTLALAHAKLGYPDNARDASRRA